MAHLNFTTNKQVERLMAIGINIDSADMYRHVGYPGASTLPQGLTFTGYKRKIDSEGIDNISPAWSAGQLIYILFAILSSSEQTWHSQINIPTYATVIGVVEEIILQIEVYSKFVNVKEIKL